MPLFEFACDDCGQPFEELLLGSSAISDVTCPACNSKQVKKQISTFASRSAGANSFATPSYSSAASCGSGSV
jgi:putative FmdB family regulatory protein